MAGPLSGIAGQQQIPLSQPSQLDQNNSSQVRGNEQNSEQENLNRVPPQGTVTAESNETNANLNDLQSRADELLAAQNDNGDSGETTRRGSLIDVVV